MTYIIPKNIKYDVMKRDNFICVKCKSNKELTIDHITPVSKGGTNDLNNLRTLCFDCNHTRGNFNPSVKEKIFSWVFTRREANTLRNDVKEELVRTVGDTKAKLSGEIQSFKDRMENRFGEIAPKIDEYLKSHSKTQEIKNVGFENTDKANRTAFEERDDQLLRLSYLLCDRLEAMEKYLGVEYVEEKHYKKIGTEEN